MRLAIRILLILGISGGCGVRTQKNHPPSKTPVGVQSTEGSYFLSDEEKRALTVMINSKISGVDFSGPEKKLIQSRILQQSLEELNLSSKVDEKTFLLLLEEHFPEVQESVLNQPIANEIK